MGDVIVETMDKRECISLDSKHPGSSQFEQFTSFRERGEREREIISLFLGGKSSKKWSISPYKHPSSLSLSLHTFSLMNMNI
jgi:hypothetical protein